MIHTKSSKLDNNNMFLKLVSSENSIKFCKLHLCSLFVKRPCSVRTYSVNCELGTVTTNHEWIEASDQLTLQLICENFKIHDNFLNENEEESLINEAENHLKRLKYQYDHWDDAIHGYRETEQRHWKEKNKSILQRVRDIAFPTGTDYFELVHVLDLEKTGYIKPHIDSVRFCGDTIAGLSLLSNCVMKLVHKDNKNSWTDILLRRRDLYIMRGIARYEYTHEILSQEHSVFRGEVIPRDRRISIICRCESSRVEDQ